MTLADLYPRYRAEIDAFNANPPLASDEFHRLAARTFHRTFEQMIRKRVRTKADALAALALLWEEYEDGVSDGLEPLFANLRDYIERGRP